MKYTRVLALAACAALLSGKSDAASVTVDPGATWAGFMNVSELPANGGGYAFGSGWGTADLAATFSGGVLTLSPNTIGDPAPYWYTPSGGPGATGNKIMEANFYVENSSTLVGQNVTFSGVVQANTLTSAHSAVAFIKDFAPDYSSNVTMTVPLTPGPFSVSLATIPAPGRHVQYGFAMKGPNVWITDVAPYGSVQIAAVPEPATLASATAALVGLAAVARRRR